ncbi:MAG: hypothetical protein Ct9H300mP14_14570 [Gammaproteobacteria bacterium]|nr:MAG: hypothetical protein Ct9H300mP14_14570 [Gammaproteobacteria bacterium]
MLLPPGDIEAVRKYCLKTMNCGSHPEPTGGSFGMIPVGGNFFERLTGGSQSSTMSCLSLMRLLPVFEFLPGGAQAHFDVRPDFDGHWEKF